jgi:hypothetical protein
MSILSVDPIDIACRALAAGDTHNGSFQISAASCELVTYFTDCQPSEQMSTEQLSPLISNGTAWRVPATAACPRSARNTAAGADRRRERGQLACVRCAKRARVVRAYASACARPRIVSREAFGRLTCARQGCKLTLCVRFKPTTATMKGRTGRPPLASCRRRRAGMLRTAVGRRPMSRQSVLATHRRPWHVSVRSALCDV